MIVKLAEKPSNDVVYVSIQTTRDELRLITQGLGQTSYSSRVDAGMRPSESDSCRHLFYTLDEACRNLGIELDYN